MRIAAKYSHLNGLEYMLVHHSDLWEEVQDAIELVDAQACKTKISREKTKPGKILYSPIEMNKRFEVYFEQFGWTQRRNTFWVTDDERLMRGIYNQPAEEQRKAIEAAGRKAIMSYNQTD